MVGPLGFLLTGALVLYKEKRERWKKASQSREDQTLMCTPGPSLFTQSAFLSQTGAGVWRFISKA